MSRTVAVRTTGRPRPRPIEPRSVAVTWPSRRSSLVPRVLSANAIGRSLPAASVTNGAFAVRKTQMSRPVLGERRRTLSVSRPLQAGPLAGHVAR